MLKDVTRKVKLSSEKKHKSSIVMLDDVKRKEICLPRKKNLPNGHWLQEEK